MRQDSKTLPLDDVNNLVGLRPQDDVLAAHDDEIVAAPFRIDFNDPRRKRVVTHRRWHGRADRNVEIDVGDFFDLLLLAVRARRIGNQLAHACFGEIW
jgi:hypothetical protein